MVGRIFGAHRVLWAIGLALLVSGAGPAGAAVIGVSGTWSNVAPGRASFLNGVGSGTIYWGANPYNTGRAATPQSSYGFAGWNTDLALPVSPGDTRSFGLGLFTHDNRIIAGTSIEQARLSLTIDIGGLQLSLAVPFLHLETLNDPNRNGLHFWEACPDAGREPCPDIVRLGTTNASSTLNLDGRQYRLEVSGFHSGGSIRQHFITQENQTNTAVLVGVLRTLTGPVQVSEPGTISLLAIGVLSIGVLARRRRAALRGGTPDLVPFERARP